MRIRTVIIVISLLCYSNASARVILISFYGEKLEFFWEGAPVLRKGLSASDKGLQKFHDEFSKVSGSLFDSLSTYKKRLALNDWLYYELIDKLCDEISGKEVNSAYLKWYFLASSGYRASVVFEKGKAYVAVESIELVYGLQKLQRSYCLDCVPDTGPYLRARFNPYNKNTLNFSFSFSSLPNFSKGGYVKKKFLLRKLDGTDEELEVEFSHDLISCLQRRGNRNLKQTFLTPLSQGTAPIIDKLDKMLEGLEDSLKVEYFTSFVRRNSRYKFDESGNENEGAWSTPEEFLFYGAGDCEDRCSFLYYALTRLLNKPLLIVTYQDHVNLAISIEMKSRCNFHYNGLPYYVIEPTTRMSNPIALGQFPMRANTRYKIIE